MVLCPSPVQWISMYFCLWLYLPFPYISWVKHKYIIIHNIYIHKLYHTLLIIHSSTWKVQPCWDSFPTPEDHSSNVAARCLDVTRTQICVQRAHRFKTTHNPRCCFAHGYYCYIRFYHDIISSTCDMDIWGITIMPSRLCISFNCFMYKRTWHL